MYLQFLSIAILIFLTVDILFYLGIRPYLQNYVKYKRRNIHILYWGFTAFSIGLLCLAVYHYYIQKPPPKFARVYLSGFTFIVMLSKVLGIVFFLLNWLVKSVKSVRNRILKIDGGYNPSRKDFIRKVGVIAAAIPFLSLNYGMLFGAFNYKIRRKSILLTNLPAAFEGLKILQVSDIHSGSFISSSPLERAVELINNENPDLVLFTGDLVNEIAEEAEPFLDVFKQIKAPLGIYSILGNHDYGDYFYDKNDEAGKLHNRNKMKEIYQSLGWNLLLNEHAIIRKGDDSIGLIGCENWGDAHRFPKYGDLQKSKENMQKCPVNILMTHDPSHWEAEVLKNHKDIDITLSGHTHGFQLGVEIPGFKWSPSQYLYKQWAGLYNRGNNYIYVNRGLGFIGYPGRLGISPEITVLTLNKATA